MMRILDFPKLESPFKRKIDENGDYVVTPEVTEGYEWVFTDDSVIAVEKLHGTNVSMIIEDGIIKSIFNRTERLPFFNKGKMHIIQGVMAAYERGYMDLLEDGQHFGELIGEKVNGNPYKIKGHIWIPFSWMRGHLKYKSWGKYPKDFGTISRWFQEDLLPLYTLKKGDKDGFVEGIVFTHADVRLAKLRKDMFAW